MNRDLVSGVALVCIAGGYYAASRSILASSLEDAFGPHGLPNILAIALACIGLLLAARGGWAVARNHATTTTFRGSPDHRPLRALGLLAIGFGYVLLVDELGYFLTIVLLLAATAAYEGAKPTWRLGAVAVGGGMFLWLLFVRLLDVAQPAGLLF
jgi:putative tricarboxylic transport membrane protein